MAHGGVGSSPLRPREPFAIFGGGGTQRRMADALTDRANRDVPETLRREITRYGGPSPFGTPMWRVVWAANVFREIHGAMRHIPRVSADADIEDIEPEKVEAGDFLTPRYQIPEAAGRGAILERWFPAETWGTVAEWEAAESEDGRRMMGEWPRQGGYQMASADFLREMPPADYWKRQIQQDIRARIEAMEAGQDPAAYLAMELYRERQAEKQRGEHFTEEVNHLHRAVVDPMLATLGTTAQRVREEIREEIGLREHLSAG